MNALHYIVNQTPTAQPLEFEFEGRAWRLFPIDTIGVLGPLERFVVQFVRANVEKLRPEVDDEDPQAWANYREDKAAAQSAVQRGLYGALTSGWDEVLNRTDAGFAEAVYRCVQYKEPAWTRDHVQRFLADPERKAEFYTAWMDYNYSPKAPTRKTQADPRPETSPPKSPSDGTGLCGML